MKRKYSANPHGNKHTLKYERKSRRILNIFYIYIILYVHFAEKLCISHTSFLYVITKIAYIFRHIRVIIFSIYFVYIKTIFVYMGHVYLYICKIYVNIWERHPALGHFVAF